MKKPQIALVCLFGLSVLYTLTATAQTSTSTQTNSSATKSTKPAASGTSSTAKSGTGAKSGTAAKPATGAAAVPPVLTTPKSKASYALGFGQGSNFHQHNIDVDPAIYLRGLRDALTGAKPAMTDDQIRAAIQDLQKTVQAAEEVKMKQAGEANKAAGAEFLAANKSKPGVMTTASGLQYKVITQGTGPKPALSDTVVCNYRGTLINGTEFDSSYKRNMPVSFPVSGVIKGWTEALQMMSVGSKYELFVPSDLAYGGQGNGPIGPNSTLVFEVELVSIQGK